MNKLVLTKQQVSLFVQENKYRPAAGTEKISRCIDGRYENETDLPALAFPGADAGELALIFATAQTYGFGVDRAKAYKALLATVGDKKQMRFHSDSHADKKEALSGCGHIKQMKLDAQAYGLAKEDVDFIVSSFTKLREEGVAETDLHGEHGESAVLLIRGEWGVYPKGTVKGETGDKRTEVFVYHQTLVDLRHREFAKELIAAGAVDLGDGRDEEYLYEVLCDVSETHLMETARRLASGLPIFEVTFDKDGGFDVEEVGKV